MVFVAVADFLMSGTVVADADADVVAVAAMPVFDDSPVAEDAVAVHQETIVHRLHLKEGNLLMVDTVN